MSALKAITKRAVVRTVARTAPLTWRWRKPGSLVVLMYHRVLPKDSPLRKTEQPGMYVSPDTLDLHIRELKQHFHLMHLNDWLRRAKQGSALPRLACAITFDDGWRDNYDFALPVLAKHGAPATIFLVSSFIGTAYRFWPNQLIELILKEYAQPGSVPFPAKLRGLVNPVITNARVLGHIDIEHIDTIVQRALKVKEDEIRALVESAGGAGTMGDVRDTVNLNEIEAMSATGLVRFGSHSATHFRLNAGLSKDRLMAEIVDSRAQLREICKQPIDLFCYPNGVTSPAAVSLVSSHYLGAVITETGWHSPQKNPHLIPRVRVHDDISSDRNAFLERLSAWL